MKPLVVFAAVTFAAKCKPPAPPIVTPVPPADPGTVTLPAWTTSPVEVDRSAGALLVDLRTGTHDGFDRLVFEFDVAVPGYRVEYVDAPTWHCASGEEIWLGGDAWVRVDLEPAAAHTEDGFPTLPFASFSTSYNVLLEGMSVCDWEGQVAWVAGTSSPDGFRVFELSDPARLVVDFKH